MTPSADTAIAKELAFVFTVLGLAALCWLVLATV